MSAWTDLHCHWVSGIDDGARTPQEGAQLLQELQDIGFANVMATPHMRPGLFDNTGDDLRQAYAAMSEFVRGLDLSLGLSCEHYFDDIVYQRIISDQALPYPGGRAILLEFWEVDFPASVERLLARLKRDGLIPVIAHPERYRAIWNAPQTLDRLFDAGAVALLDVAALAGKYGQQPRRCAEQLLEDGYYVAACSDAHRPADVEQVVQGIDLVRKRYGEAEVERLLNVGPREILAGTARA